MQYKNVFLNAGRWLLLLHSSTQFLKYLLINILYYYPYEFTKSKRPEK